MSIKIIVLHNKILDMIIGDFVEVKIVFKKEMIENVIKESSIKNDEKEICIEVNFKLLFY